MKPLIKEYIKWILTEPGFQILYSHEEWDQQNLSIKSASQSKIEGKKH